MLVFSQLRMHDENLFLALYTAYDEKIPKNKRDWMAKKHIKIYGKGDDDDEFILNLEKDYYLFQQTKKDGKSDFNKQKSSKLERDVQFKHHVMNHLKNVSNQNVIIPITNEQEISVSDMIHEVALETDVGMRYMKEWLNTIALIQKIRKKK